MDVQQRGLWSSRLAFIIATSGAAVDLGNIWKFPYIAGENGGGAFVLFYLLCVFLIGVPIMVAEILIGRRARQNPADAMYSLARSHKTLWHWLGFTMVIGGFLVLSFYSVIAGWTLDYVVLALQATFKNATAETINGIFTNLISRPGLLLFYHTLVMLTCSLIVGLGIKAGIERASLLLFPIMLVLLFILIGYAINSGYFGHGIEFFFSADFSKLSPKSALIALGHAFFTLSLACGTIMVYGSYLDNNICIGKTSVIIAFIDTIVALLAGLAIFPLVFANNLAPAAGPGLIFQTLPLAFGHMPFGTFFAIAFFVMLFFAAFTSAISLLEPSVSWLVERSRFSRLQCAGIVGFGIWFLGIGSVLSFNVWSDVKLFGMTFFDNLDHLTANIMLPLGGLVIAIFAGYTLSKADTQAELRSQGGIFFQSWRLVLRYITPLIIIIVFLNLTKIINL